MDTTFLVSWFFLLGLVMGSFYNVVVYRLPRGQSLVKPPSSCPQCGHRLTPLELIPVLSYLMQKGHCKACGGIISMRYPIIELVTALGFAFVAFHSTSWPSLIVGVVFFSLLLVLALIDLDHKVLPNVLTLPGIILGLFFSLLGWTTSFGLSLLGGVTGFVLLFAIALISRGGMGMGDVKMMALVGTFLGWKAVFYVLFGASVLGSVGGLIFLYLTKKDRKTPIPFGPSIAGAAFIVYLLSSWGMWLKL